MQEVDGDVDTPAVPPRIPEPRPDPSQAEDSEAPPPQEAATTDAETPFDPDATTRLALWVVNADGVGVPEARVTLGGMRDRERPGTWHSYRGDAPSGSTDANGRLVLWPWTWVRRGAPTLAVDLTVEHPEYSPFRDSNFLLRAGEQRIVLGTGSTLVVSGWIGRPGRRAAPIEVRVDHGSELGPEAWRRLPDGSLETVQLTPGPHLLRVSHRSPDGASYSSDCIAFELGARDWKALDVELKPHVTLEGSLSLDVPRPVVDGRVLVNVFPEEPPQGLWLSSTREAPVASDGSFRVEGLAPGVGEVFALCEGWSASVGPLARVSLPDSTPPLVVAMEPTSSLEVRVLDTDGRPLEAARVSVNPNLRFAGGGANLVPWRAWSRTTDAAGRATFAQVPAGRHFVVASHTDFGPEDPANRLPLVELTAGEPSALDVRLRPLPDARDTER